MSKLIRNVTTHFDPDTGRFLLQLRKVDVGLGDAPVTHWGKEFRPKDEVHITLIGPALGRVLKEEMDPFPTVAGAVRKAITGTPWAYRPRDEWHHVIRQPESDKGYAESIVRMVDVPPLDGFYARLVEATGIAIPPRPVHVTLYTWNDPEGIGLATWDEFRRRVTGPVSPEDLQ